MSPTERTATFSVLSAPSDAQYSPASVDNPLPQAPAADLDQTVDANKVVRLMTQRHAGEEARHRLVGMRVRRSEPLALALQRMALEQLEIAHDGLAHPSDSEHWDKGVHEARKAMKRTRALLRLVRDQLGYETYRNENVVLRDQARRLSAVRSARVVADTLDHLVEKDAHVASPTVIADLRRELLRRHAEQTDALRRDADGLAAAKVAVGCARNRIAAWPVLDIHIEGDELLIRHRLMEEFASLEPGIRRVYRRGRRAMKLATRERNALAFHAWRKRVKYLRYQIEALQGCWTDVMEGLEASLGDLAETLGEEHDLADLARLISTETALVPSPLQRNQLLAAIDRRRRKLQSRALRLGERIYAEPPERFTTRLDAYWNAWRPSFT